MSVLSVVEAHQVLDEIERIIGEAVPLPWKISGLGYVCSRHGGVIVGSDVGPATKSLVLLSVSALPTLVREWRSTLELHYENRYGDCNTCYGEFYFSAVPVDWPCREVTSVLACLEPFASLLGGGS